MQACDNDPNGPIPSRNNPCGAFGNDENLVRTDAQNVRDDAASLASASCDLQKIVPGGQTCGDSSGLWVGLAIALSIVSGGVAVAGEGAVATVAGFVSITSGLAASIPDVRSCIDGGDQQACMNMAISLAGAALGASGIEAAGDAEELAATAHGTNAAAELAIFAQKAGITSMTLGLGTYVLNSANSYINSH
jgi:hypothetical protein